MSALVRINPKFRIASGSLQLMWIREAPLHHSNSLHHSFWQNSSSFLLSFHKPLFSSLHCSRFTYQTKYQNLAAQRWPLVAVISNIHDELSSVLHKTLFSEQHTNTSLKTVPAICNQNSKRKVKVSSHYHIAIPPSELQSLLDHVDFPLASRVLKRTDVARQQEAKSGAFFLLRNHNGLWLFMAVFSSQDSRCFWMVQHTFCHFHRLCSTVTSPSL